MAGLLACFFRWVVDILCSAVLFGLGDAGALNPGWPREEQERAALVPAFVSVRAAGDANSGAAAERVASYFTPFSGFQDPCSFRTKTICPTWYALCVPMCAISLAYFCSVGSSHVSTNFSKSCQYFVELLDGVVPRLGIEFVEGFVVVSAEFRDRLPGEFRQLAAVPEQEVVSELADGVIAAAVFPVCLLGRQAFDGHIDRHEPILFRVGSL